MLSKCIRVRQNDGFDKPSIDIEYWGATFRDVLKEAPKGSRLILELYKSNQIGWVFVDHEDIGFSGEATQDDYWVAYDRLIGRN